MDESISKNKHIHRDKDDYITHIVKENETLEQIAKYYEVPIKQIIKYNQLENTNIEVNDELLIEKKDKIPLFIIILMIIALLLGTSFITFAIIDYTNNQNGGENSIIVGNIVFTFNEAESAINIANAFPISDEEGKKMIRDNEYFDFMVSFKSLKENNKVAYEINLTKVVATNAIDEKYITVYLEEDNAPATLFEKKVIKYSELEDSSVRLGSKVIHVKTVSNDVTYLYRLRMWLNQDYKVDNQIRTFKCIVNVNGTLD